MVLGARFAAESCRARPRHLSPGQDSSVAAGAGSRRAQSEGGDPDATRVGRPLPSYGWMFWFRWNRLPGSYLRLIDTSLS